MKFSKIISVFVLLILSVSIFSNNASDVWARLYKRPISPELKLSVMLNMVEINDRSMIPLFEEILMEEIVANLSNKRNVNQESSFIELAKLVVKKLGVLKAKGSASYIYQVYLNHQDSLLQAECLLALGSMRATEFIDDIEYILHTKNQRPTKGAYTSTDIHDESKVAFAAISALDRFRDIRGYSSIFFASIGWYSDRVTNYADKVLSTVTENPVEALIPILVDGDYDDKKKAIQEVYECNAPNEDKIIAARVALKQGHDNIPGSIRQSMVLTTLRKRAIYTTWQSRSTDTEDVYYITKSVRDGTDLEERVYAIKALGVNGSTEAISSLTTMLQEYNLRNAIGMGITFLEEDIIRELISTLGNSGNPEAEYALMEAIYSGYPNGIIRKAKEALENLGSLG